MHTLSLHDHSSAGPIRSIAAAITPVDGGCHVRFRLEGDISAIVLPEWQPPVRTDLLWQTTCMEVFWQPEGGPFYREFNLSPSTRWACYDFEDYRLNGRDGLVDALALACAASADSLVLEADIRAALPLPARIALNAIVKDKTGAMQYWALSFAPGKPDFHHVDTRSLRIGGV